MTIIKTTQAERELNSNIMSILMYSFFDANIVSVANCLAGDGCFLGKSKEQFLGWLNSQFTALRKGKIHGVGVHTGICMDILPGAEVFEFKYALDQRLIHDDGVFYSSANMPARKGEVILCFAFQLNQGMIRKIVRTKNYYPQPFLPKNELEINYN